MDKEYIENRMKELEAEFKQLEELSKKTADEYNQKLNELQTEGQQKLNQIKERREQIRGEFTALSYVIHPELRPKEYENQPLLRQEQPPMGTPTEVNEVNGPAPVDNVLEMSEVAPKKEEAAQVTTLSPEELAKINKVTKPQPKKDEKDDIPDYLKG